ncbi:MAG TPA: FAD-dependent oxidoreductase [Sulfurovum sp.]|uniref:FAD-dependent oxidoreductase n=1 Tax=Sulfurovum sp. TaxID=1969726 RepID=UPI002F9547A7
MHKKTKVAIIGGGVAGVTAALHLAQSGLDITLFEKRAGLVDGPPWCHLHAGGNLYREISDAQCVTLLKQSVDFVKFYPFVVDHRPTVIAVPVDDRGMVEELLPRLELLRSEYEKLIESDRRNKVLGESEQYYTLYSREKMEMLKTLPIVDKPNTTDEWMIPVARHMDLDKVKFPLIVVQEYGLNIFRLAAGSMSALQNFPNVTIRTQSSVQDVQKVDASWKITYRDQNDHGHEAQFDYLVNAAGFRTGQIDDMLGVSSPRMVEFKASYISKWEEKKGILFPEIIFHGERGTPRGMAQFTPYPGGYFQLHGMTHDITLYEDGLSKSTGSRSQPELEKKFIEKIEKGWSREEITERTYNAIAHVEQFMPAFANATVGSRPLFGAQQIPGRDASLRVAEVSFPLPAYARCEIVKVSSSIDMAKAIAADLAALGYLDAKTLTCQEWIHRTPIDEEALRTDAERIATERGYPACMANRNVGEPSHLEEPFSIKKTERIENVTTYMDSRCEQRYRA